MKKVLLTAVAALTLAASAYAQCQNGNVTSGFSPAAPANLPGGDNGAAYSTDILFVVPDSITIEPASIPGIPAQILAFLPPTLTLAVEGATFGGATGLPPGLAVTCGVGNCQYNAGQQGCVRIAGTPTSGGTFPLAITADIATTIDPAGLGLPVPLPPQQVSVPGGLTSGPYTIIITGPSSVNELNPNTFNVLAPAPNPFDATTNIVYNTPSAKNVEFTVHNMVGGLVYKNTYKAAAGKNTITFNSNGLASGLYVYTLSNGNEVKTGRMTISK